MHIKAIHHIAIICANYESSKRFYKDILGFDILKEVYREERDSWKLDLSLNGNYTIELFSFPKPPKRTSQPEAAGLRHLAFEVDDITLSVKQLQDHGVITESVRVDPYTNSKFTFFSDPDGLPLELYETA